jgi:uncharacterized protein HemX
VTSSSSAEPSAQATPTSASVATMTQGPSWQFILGLVLIVALAGGAGGAWWWRKRRAVSS